jgi:hypothetical protein
MSVSRVRAHCELSSRLELSRSQGLATITGLARDLRGATWNPHLEPGTGGPWPVAIAEQLLHELLIFAWHTVKWDARVARLLLGMSPQVAETLAGSAPSD